MTTRTARPGLRGICSVCERDRRVRLDGVLAVHPNPRGWTFGLCPGTGQPPTVSKGQTAMELEGTTRRLPNPTGQESTPDQTMTPLPDAPPSSGSRCHVRLDTVGGRSALFLDDLDIASTVSRLDLTVTAGQLPDVVLHLAPGALQHDGEATVKIDDGTRAVLLELGWTPPQQVVGYVHTDPDTGETQTLKAADVSILTWTADDGEI